MNLLKKIMDRLISERFMVVVANIEENKLIVYRLTAQEIQRIFATVKESFLFRYHKDTKIYELMGTTEFLAKFGFDDFQDRVIEYKAVFCPLCGSQDLKLETRQCFACDNVF